MRNLIQTNRPYVAAIVLVLVLFISSTVSGAWLEAQPADRSSDTRVKIGFIGDSITHGPKTGLSVVEDEINSLGNTKFEGINQGVSGSTTSDWQPNKVMLDTALSVFKANNVHIVSIMLGTNDARADIAISPSLYQKNMSALINALFASGISQVIINYPPFVVPGAYSGLWTNDSISRLTFYRAQLDTLANRHGIIRGDMDAFEYFKGHTYLLKDGVHPTEDGNAALARLWAGAFKKAQTEMVARETLTKLGLLPSNS